MTRFSKFIFCVFVAVFMNTILTLLMIIAEVEQIERATATGIFCLISGYYAIEIFVAWSKKK